MSILWVTGKHKKLQASYYLLFITICCVLMIPMDLMAEVNSSNDLKNNYFRFGSREQESRYNSIARKIKCLECSGRSVAESEANFAVALKEYISISVKAGHSDNEIISSLVEKYGERILFKPPLKSYTLALWLAPIIFLLFFICINYLKFIRSRK